RTLSGFCVVRFLLGAGEAANWPGAIKASAEWFPPDRRAWAVALLDSGTSLGGLIAPFLALALYRWFDDWRPVCALSGSLGFIWVAVWLRGYPAHGGDARIAQSHSAVQPATPEVSLGELPPLRWRALLCYRQVWGIMLGRF